MTKHKDNLSEQNDANNLARTGHQPSAQPGQTDSRVSDGSNGPITEGEKLGGNVIQSNDAVNKRLDQLNEKNAEGHEKNVAEDEKRIEQEVAARGDGPTLARGTGFPIGKEDNGNTPVVNTDGSKSWHPPGVAGVAEPKS